MLYSNDQKQDAASKQLEKNGTSITISQSASLELANAPVSAAEDSSNTQASQLRRQSIDLPASRAAAASSMQKAATNQPQQPDSWAQRNISGSELQEQHPPSSKQATSSSASHKQQAPLSLNEQLVNAAQTTNQNAAKRSEIQSSKSPRRQGVAGGQSPKRAITASNYSTSKPPYQATGVAAAAASSEQQINDNTSAASTQKQQKLQKNSATAGQQQKSNKAASSKNKQANDTGKNSAGNQRKHTAGEIKLLSSQQNISKGQSNRSNSISRRSGASNSSMVVNQAAADGSTTNSHAQKKGKSVARPLPRQRAGAATINNQSENKKGEKSSISANAGAGGANNAKVPTPMEKQTAASLEKAKLAEEIKLNVAAVGMDLLNNSAAAPTKQVNNLVSPKNNNLMGVDQAAIDGDDEDEDSPIRLPRPPKTDEKERDSKIGQTEEKGKISIQHIENTDDSEDEDTMHDGRNETEDGEDDDDLERKIKMTALKQINLPPPLELIAKTVYKEEEPIKTGAPIAFVSLAQMAGGRFKNEEVCGKTREQLQAEGPEPEFPVDLKPDIATLRANTTNIQQYMASMNENGYVVYCRFGREYIGHLAKQHQLMINNPNLSSHMRQIATYLINIKKLVKDHNIESDSKDFNKLKTCGKTNMKKKSELPPTPFYVPTGPQDKTLIFESRFETGNLLASMKVSDNEYDMVLQNDINTNGHTQWFFFRVSNTRKGQTVKFNILNLAKPDSLYNEGMRVLSFSQLSRDGPEQLSWHRVGQSISYHTNTFKREGNRWNRCYYTLTFTHTFTENNDQVYFAHCFPYTYTDLCDDLSRIERDRFSQNFVNRSTLCRTLAGNRCEYITITSKERDPNSEKSKAKKGVFISARVHPGESNASWMMKGVIEFLVSNTAEAQALRENFVFKIVPMLNPDGVINGNYRCSLAGQDLNRRWKIPSKTLHPVNWHVKRMVRDFNRERDIALVCDLHGHSRRKNIFMYGNNFEQRPHATRVFPFIMSKLLDFFSFEYSRFSVHKSKEATARVTLWRELKIPNVFTMEASFCGANKGLLDKKHFMPEHLMLAGRKLLEGLIVYTKLQVTPLKPSQIAATASKQSANSMGPALMLEEEKQSLKYTTIRMQEIEKELTTNKQLIEMTKGDEDGDDTAGSDSEPSEDNLSEEEMAKIIPVKRKESLNKIKEKNKKPELVRKNSGKRLDDKSPSARGKQPPQLQPRSNPTRSPIKRIFPYQNPYDRMMRRGLKKVEMVDAWTQTSNRGSDTEDSKKKQKTTQPAQLKSGGHQRITSNGGVLDPATSGSHQARGSVENIYHPQSHDAKSLQLQQDRRLAQIHRQSTQDQNKMGLQQPGNERQFSTGKTGGQFPHTQSQQSSQQLQNASPSMMPANQIRIRKDPIKHQPSYKKPPNLAIYEEALLKQTSTSSKIANINAQGQSFKTTGQLHQTMRSAEPPESMVKLPKQSMHGEMIIGQQPLIDGRSPALIKSSNKLAIDQRGKTFTATRLGNFPSGKNDQHFFYFKGENGSNSNAHHQYQQQPQQQQQVQQQMRQTKVTNGLGSNEMIMNTTNSQASNKQRVFINNNAQGQQALIKEPISPSKRSQNYAAMGVAGSSSRKASVNQRSPILSSSFQQANNQLVHSSANKQQSNHSNSNTRESFQFRAGVVAVNKQGADQHHHQQLDGSQVQSMAVRQIPSTQMPTSSNTGGHLDNNLKSRNPDYYIGNSRQVAQNYQYQHHPKAQSTSQNSRAHPTHQQHHLAPDGISQQKLAEFRSNRSTTQKYPGGNHHGNSKV